MSYDPYWSEVREDDSALERERQERDLVEWEQEQRWDRLRRDDPCKTVRGHDDRKATP